MKKTEDINYELMAKLSNLYMATGEDWKLEVSHCLTEPTCPSAYVYPEGQFTARYRADRDSIEEAINRSLELAHREQVLDEIIEQDFPISAAKPTFPRVLVTYEVPPEQLTKLIEELARYHARSVEELDATTVRASILKVFYRAVEEHVDDCEVLTLFEEGDQ